MQTENPRKQTTLYGYKWDSQKLGMNGIPPYLEMYEW